MRTLALWLCLAAAAGHAATQTEETSATDHASSSPVSIELLGRLPSDVTSSDTVTVTARVRGGCPPAPVTLVYALGSSGTTTSVSAFDDGVLPDAEARDYVYTASIPAQEPGERVAYCATVTTADNSQSTSSLQGYYGVQTPPRPELRVMQADSWAEGILTPKEVEELVDTCRKNNLNVLMPEVRKVGDAAYESCIEPRATNIAPEFDPLAYTLKLAHDTSQGKKRLEVHGWFVMHRIAKGETLDARHVLSLHPEFEMLKRDGTHNERNRYLDPGHPGAVDHNVAVILDCLSRYDLDGINCDYIRYPEDEGPWGYNPTSVARFNAVYGKSGTPAPDDPDWAAWRRECVTLELKKLYVKAWQMKPRVLVTCDTANWGEEYTSWTASRPYSEVYQDWVGWLRQGILDYNSLMNYTRADTTGTLRFQGWASLSMQNDALRGSIIGVGAYLHPSIQATMDQLLWLRQEGAEGFFIYDWKSEIQGNKSGQSREQFYQALRTQITPTWADPPVPTWKTSPTTGIFQGVVTSAGKPVDHAKVEIPGHPETQTVTDGSGWYAIMNLTPDKYRIRFSKAGMPEQTLDGVIEKVGQIATVDASL